MELPWSGSHGLSWNFHDVKTMVISCGQNDMKIPWKFHGNSMEFLCEKTMGYFCKGVTDSVKR